MKILTINTHSLIEQNYERKLDQFVTFLLQKRPDIVAMQEVNQSIAAAPAAKEFLHGFVPCKEDAVVRTDNHAMQVAKRLQAAGVSCSWTWLPMKIGYGKLDEGIAIFSLGGKIAQTDYFGISRSKDYGNWKKRDIVGVRLEDSERWFYTVHMGWWTDEEEPFQYHWDQFELATAQKKEQTQVWLMGDFNSPAEVRGQGYDYILSNGWNDTYQMAQEKDSGITVEGVIDGWRELLDESVGVPEGMRIDHIWCSQKVPVIRSQVVLNGENGPVVSDHFGVMIETEE